MKRVITGIQATGDIHIGNYIGAMRPMIDLQADNDCFMMIADLHALNTNTDPQRLRESIIGIASAYLAAGLDPEKAVLFRQSQVAAHAELAVILAPSASHGMLERAHAYKDAVAKGKTVSAGLFYYPILMAADILIYKADTVPVGADQQQHLEMTREIAERFNGTYGETFVLPQAQLMSEEAILKGLDGRKMSKSYDNVIGLFDEEDVVRAKVAKLVTDSRTPEEPKDPNDTFASIYRHVAPGDEFLERYTAGGIGYKEAKDKLAEAVISFTEPIRTKKKELDANPGYVEEVLRAGAEKAKKVAGQTLIEVFTRVGLTV